MVGVLAFLPSSVAFADGPSFGVERSQWNPTDLRSPDARDAATAATTSRYTDAISSLSREQVASSTKTKANRSLDWGDVGIGAGGMTVLTLIGLGGLVLFTRHRGIRKSQGPIVSS